MVTTNDRQAGAHTASGDAPARKKFPWWLLLLGLLALALLLWLLSRGGDDVAETQTGDTAQGETAGDASGDASGNASGDASGAGGGAAGAGAGGAGGQITAGNATVYPGAPNAKVDQFTGDKAVGTGVTVESVVSDEGFWVGDANDRVFVRLRTGGDESGPQVKAGDRVDFEGSVKQHDDSFAQQLGVEGNEGAEELTSMGAHIEVPEVAISDK